MATTDLYEAFELTTISSVESIYSGVVVPPEKKIECEEFLNRTQKSYPKGTYCPGLFDDWLCWPDTKAGTVAKVLCPDFIEGFENTRYAHRVCEENGNWFYHPDFNRTWSNYTTCVNVEDYEWKQQINLIYEIGYSISLIAILLSLATFSYFKTLKCARITLHMNLFASFAANNLLWLVWYRVVIRDSNMLQQSGAGCIALHLVLHYFLLTNYAMMLCEGFYLHTVLVAAFISEQKLVRWLIVLGWSAPALIIIIYGCILGTIGDAVDRKHCWSESGNFTYVLIVPVVASMALNFIFLINIVRVLLLKLKAPAGPMQGNGPSRTILQAFRATLLLVPLLGLQYILTPFRPDPGHYWEHAHEVLSAFTASFQGLWVATLFCFFNGEVIAQMKRKWGNTYSRARANSYTATQVSFVRCIPQSPGEEKV